MNTWRDLVDMRVHRQTAKFYWHKADRLMREGRASKAIEADKVAQKNYMVYHTLKASLKFHE